MKRIEEVSKPQFVCTLHLFGRRTCPQRQARATGKPTKPHTALSVALFSGSANRRYGETLRLGPSQDLDALGGPFPLPYSLGGPSARHIHVHSNLPLPRHVAINEDNTTHMLMAPAPRPEALTCSSGFENGQCLLQACESLRRIGAWQVRNQTIPPLASFGHLAYRTPAETGL